MSNYELRPPGRVPDIGPIPPADTPDPRPVPCCTDTLGMPIPCQHRPVSPPSELTALAELLDWVDLIDAPGTVLADLVQRSRIELDAARAAPQADEELREAQPWRYQGETDHAWGCCLHGPVLPAAAPVPAGLDVERLERALGNLYEQKWPHVGNPPRLPTTLFGAYAEEIAAEYAALSQLPEDAP